MTLYSIRKYSFLKDNGINGDWEHFPSRNDIVLTALTNSLHPKTPNDYIFKIIWKSSVLEELVVSAIPRNSEQPLAIYAKFPSVGFKYCIINEYQRNVVKRFQVSFNSPNEFQQFVNFLHENKFPIKDDSKTAVPYIQPSSQFVRPTVVQAYNEPYSQWTTSQSQASMISMSQAAQPQQPILPMTNSTQFERQELVEPQPPSQVSDFLSQILNPKPKELKDLSDEQLKWMLGEKLRDVKFINFVSTYMIEGTSANELFRLKELKAVYIH